MTIRAFIANGNTYTFPTAVGDQEFNAPFGSIPARITKLPGSDGGFDEYGFSRGASDPATVEFTIVLISDLPSGMQTLRDGLRTIAAWGKGRLIDTINGIDRWCWARIVLTDIKEQRMGQTDLHQPVKLTFSVSDPYWYTVGTNSLWGSIGNWGGGAGVKWGGVGASINPIATEGTFMITNNGNADTLLKFTINNSSGSNASYPLIRRIVNGAIKDELYYYGTISTGTQLILKPENYTATIAGVSVLSNLTYMHPQWMRLTPGVNNFTASVIGAVTIYASYFERFT